MNLRPSEVRFDGRGLVPAVVQDARTREVLTLAYMNGESLRRTLAEGETWLWSRSRAELWRKGATSGHTQRVVEVRLDCDADALVVLVEPRGPACHTGARSCFHRRLGECRTDDGAESDKADGVGVPSVRNDAATSEAVAAVEGAALEDESESESKAGSETLGVVFERLFAVVEGRRRERPEHSYTTYLFEQGLNKILKKVGEEAAETIIAAKDGDTQALTNEMSDLLYHLVVLMAERGVTPGELARELARRGREKRQR